MNTFFLGGGGGVGVGVGVTSKLYNFGDYF